MCAKCGSKSSDGSWCFDKNVPRVPAVCTKIAKYLSSYTLSKYLIYHLLQVFHLGRSCGGTCVHMKLIASTFFIHSRHGMGSFAMEITTIDSILCSSSSTYGSIGTPAAKSYLRSYLRFGMLRGTRPFTTKIWIHICSCHTFSSFLLYRYFFDISLLLIVCALRWYIKSLYKHLFLEDTSKHARVTQKIAPPNWNMCNSKAPWATAPKLVFWLSTILSCDITSRN